MLLKKGRKSRAKLILLIAAILAQPFTHLPAQAENAPLTYTGKEELSLFYFEEDLVVTATKQATPLSKVPAVATVISAEQIRNMGARTLSEALKAVPGIGVYQDAFHDKVVEVRGIKSLTSSKILLLVDGIRLNNLLYGGAFVTHADMPLDNVKRIEVIRGPASALYGANAFAAIINVITKEGADIDGVDLHVGGGSWDSQHYGAVAGKKSGDLQAAVFFNYVDTNGFRDRVEQDSDPYASSVAPGNTDLWRRRFDSGLTASWKDLRLEYRHMESNRGPYIGVASALNDESHAQSIEDIGELTYRHVFGDNLTVMARTYASLLRTNLYWEIYSEGFAGVYPDGLLGNPRFKNQAYGFELQADYKLFKDNLLTIGITQEQSKQYDVQHWANFNPNTGAPLAGGFQNVTDTLNWNQNRHRTIKAWYVQDSWKLFDKIELISGVRHDEYSDFGNTTNPRAGVVWEAMKDTYIKLLAGRAFRAPTFEELYNQNNPAVTGNPNLDPEVITTTEVSVETKKIKDTTLRLSYFKNYIRDIIELQQVGAEKIYTNGGRSKTAGVEAEARYDFNKTDHVYTNFTWLEPKRLGSGGEITDIPKWRANIGGNVAFARYFNFNTNLFISADRPRTVSDSRKDIPSYATIDAALTVKNFKSYLKGLEIQLIARNLLDKRYDDAAPSTTVPGDYPRDGREIFLEARYKF
ncbi:MAG: TonB-dependent receptor [Nitrospirota bacterium]|nr:TonB-dependent receptor [Nitrospirota bacterium]